jgi:hypothetical protein
MYVDKITDNIIIVGCFIITILLEYSYALNLNYRTVNGWKY